MSFGHDDLVGLSAVAIATLVQSREVPPGDVVRAHLEQVGRLDATVGAFQVARGEAALDEAEALWKRDDLEALPLAGVPVAIKDNVAVAGEPTRNGSLATSSHPAAADHELVARLRAAGAIVIGKTRVPELCAYPFTDGNFGIARNPWNLARTPGGSSGGSAAAVASAMVPVAHGSDGGGSIRIPAAACGVLGIKPGIGVVPGAAGRTGWYGLSANGPLATTVDDLALMLSIMAARPDLREPALRSSPLRVATSTLPIVSGVSVSAAWSTPVAAFADVLGGAGHEVRPADPPYDRNMIVTMGARGVAGIAEDADGLSLGLIERRTRPPVVAGRVIRRFGLLRDAGRDAWRREAADFFADVDVLLTPTLTQAVPPAEGWTRRSWPANIRASNFAMFTGAWNLAGFPALALPAGFDSDGMPLSIQLVAAEGGEGLLLSVAKQLEALRPWPRHASLATVPGSRPDTFV
jgi:amidase